MIGEDKATHGMKQGRVQLVTTTGLGLIWVSIRPSSRTTSVRIVSPNGHRNRSAYSNIDRILNIRGPFLT